jgi:hypothetical protein
VVEILKHQSDGRKGVGKSSVLMSAVYWARKNNWLVVFISDGKQRKFCFCFFFFFWDESARYCYFQK